LWYHINIGLGTESISIKVDDDLYLVNKCKCVRRWRWLSVDVLIKMVIGDNMCCDYFGIELWHCVCEDFGSYDVVL